MNVRFRQYMPSILLCCMFFLGITTQAGARAAQAVSVNMESLSFLVELDGVTTNDVHLFGSPAGGRGGIDFVDGKTDIQLKGKPVKLEKQGNRLSFKESFKGESNLESAQVLTQGEKCILWHVAMKNTGKSERWIEVRLQMPFALDAGWEFWDGFESKVAPREASRSDMRGMFPLAAAYGNGKGLAAGIEAHQLRSWICGGVKGNVLSYSTRMVLDPGGSDEVTFVIFPFKSNFGYLDAVQRYYELFPDVFIPAPDIDARIRMACAQYLFWDFTGAGQKGNFGLMRKACAGNDWCYAACAGLRVGDWWPSSLSSGWKSAKTGKEYTPGDVESYTKDRISRLKRGEESGILPMAYAIPNCAEEQMVKDHFPDSVLDPKDPDVRVRYDPWVYKDQICSVVFPYGNSFGKKTFEDFDRLAKEWPIQSFCFDTGSPASPHFGKGSEVTPGKAYEKGKGVFANLGSALSLLTERVHTYRQNGYKMGTLVNLDGGQGYYTWLTADAGIYEHPPQIHLYGYDPIHLKLMLGSKALTWWFGYDIPGWESMSREDLDKAYRALVDYTLLYSLQMGAYPNPSYVMGVPKMVSWMPVITDMVTTQGWQASPGFTADSALWTSRYGKGVGACLVLGNPTMDSVDTDIRIPDGYLAGGRHAFASYDGGAYACSSVRDGTEAKVTVPSRTPVVLRSVLSIRKNVSFKAVSSFNLPVGEPGKINVKLACPSQVSTEAVLWIPPGRVPSTLTVNGKTVNYTVASGSASARMDLVNGENTVEFNLEPLIEVLDPQAVREFKFYDKSAQPLAKILAAGPAGDDCAKWIQSYFDAYYRYAEQKQAAPMDVVASAGDSPCVVIGTAKAGVRLPENRRAVVKVSGSNLVVCGADEKALKDAMEVLFKVLDEKYVWWGYFAGNRNPAYLMNGNSPAARKLGIEKSYLPYFK